MKIKMGGTYKTECGYNVRIYATDGDGDCPVHGAFEYYPGCWASNKWTADGKDREVLKSHNLVEVKPKHVRWMNVYRYLPGFETRQEADANAHDGRIACLRLEFPEGEGLE